MNRFIRVAFALWLPVALWMGVMFSVSSIPGGDLPGTAIPHADKLAHTAEYVVLGFLLMRALSGSFRKINLAKMISSAIIVAVVYAVFEERHQLYVPGRMCDLFDFLADFIGANVGILLYKFYKMRGIGHGCH